MNNLDVQLIIHPDCKLTVIDDNSYLRMTGSYSSLVKNLSQYVSIEYLMYKDTELATDGLKIETFSANRENMITNTVFPIYKDGTYCYYKIMIPSLDYLLVESDNNLYSEFYISNQTFFYNGAYYIYAGDNIVFDTPLTKEQAYNHYINDILIQSKQLSITQIYNMAGSQTFTCKKEIFTICNLIKCFVSLQNKTLSKLSANNCYDYSDESKYKDFLLSTIYVLDYLKDINDFREAQRILENISGCNFLCSEYVIKDSCGCHG